MVIKKEYNKPEDFKLIEKKTFSEIISSNIFYKYIIRYAAGTMNHFRMANAFIGPVSSFEAYSPEDLIHKVYLKIMQQRVDNSKEWDRLTIEQITARFIRTIRLTIIDEYRKLKTGYLNTEDVKSAYEQDGIIHKAEIKMNKLLSNRKIGKLCKELFELKLEGSTHQRIAKIYNISLRTAKTRWSECRKIFTSIMTKEALWKERIRKTILRILK